MGKQLCAHIDGDVADADVTIIHTINTNITSFIRMSMHNIINIDLHVMCTSNSNRGP